MGMQTRRVSLLTPPGAQSMCDLSVTDRPLRPGLVDPWSGGN